MKNLRKIMSVLVLSATVFSLSPAQIANAQTREAVTTSALNFRDRGSIYGRVIDVVPKGETLEVLETTEKWALVKFENKTGWVSLSYLVYKEEVKAMTAITNIKESKLRRSASFTSTTLTTIKIGSVAKLLSVENGWYKITYNGTTGYVFAPEWIASPQAPAPTPIRVSVPVSGKYLVYSPIKVYTNALDAQARRNSVGTYAAGEYLIYRNYSGMLNITKHSGVAGGWINPIENVDNTPVATKPATTTATKPATTTATKPAATTTATKPASTTTPTSGTYKAVVPLTTYSNALDAKARTNSVGQYAAGTYYIYRSYSGMLNISRNPGEAGGWINPAQNVSVTPPTTTTATKPATTTAPATKPNPDTVISKSSVNMRREPSNLSTILRNLPAGARAVMIGKNSNWIKIEYMGQIGYSYITYWDIPATTLAKFTTPVATKPVVTTPSTTTPSTTSPVVTTTTTPLPKYNPNADGVLKVYLDPGHMGIGKGAISTVTGELVDENTINYRVAVLAKEVLEERGYKVYISKNDINEAVGLAERAEEANALGVDIFVSIHCNSFINTTASGTLGFWAGEKLNPAVSDWQIQSKTLSQYLAQSVGSVLGKYSAPSDTSYGSSFYINRNSVMPSTLLELGFISNFQDATILNAAVSQQEIATQIANGIDKFFGR